EMLVTRLYMQPCLMMRAYQVYADLVTLELGDAMKDKEEGGAKKEKPKAKDKDDNKSDQEKNAEIVAKVDALRSRFCNLCMGIYDLHRESDIRVFQVFLRQMLEFTTRGKTKNLILVEGSLEWGVFREVFLQG